MMRFAATVVIVLLATGCGDDKASPTAPSPISINRAPQASGSIPDVTLIVNGAATTIDIAAHFSDPDGDTLSYSVSSAGDSVTVSISSSAVSLAPVRAGITMITVVARDPSNLSAEQTFAVTVEPGEPAINRAPQASGSIPDVTLIVNGAATTIDIAAHFSDPDGDTLSYSVSSTGDSVTVSISGSAVSLAPVRAGITMVTVVARDPSNLSAEQTFAVTVEPGEPAINRAPQASGSIPDVTLIVNGAATTIDIAAHFSDPDGDTLSYSVSSAGDSVTVSISSSAVSLAPVRAGITMITVVARDPGGLSAEQTFAVTVEPEPDHAPATVTGVGFNDTPPNGTDYRAGDRISIGIRFSKPVLWESGTLPTLAVAIGSHTRIATTYTGTTDARDFRSFYYVVRPDDMDADGISVPVDALQGDIVDEAGVRADLSLGAHAVRNDLRQKVNGSEGGGNGGDGNGNGTCGLQLQGNGYTVCYDEGYRADAEFVRDVLNPGAARFRTRYRTSSTPVDIYLLAEPTTVHGVMIRPGSALAYGGPAHLAIYIMARSAPAMQGACCSSLGLYFTDVDYQRTVLVHEYSTAFLHHYAGFIKWLGWFVQGLEQYEGFTAAGNPDLWQRTAEKVYRDNTISCGRGSRGGEQLIVSEVYFAGALVLRYLADRFGEASHIRILDSGRMTLTEAIADEQPPGETPCELFDHFRNWMYENYGLGEPVP